MPATTPTDALKPGQWVWYAEAVPQGPMLMLVSITQQKAYLYRNGVRVAVTTVSTGKKGHDTPTGVFTILQKNKDHKSSLYKDSQNRPAAMPYMQRLTWDGIALHSGNLPGYPASHGCVRLPMQFSELLFAITRKGMTVVIADDPDTEAVEGPPQSKTFLAAAIQRHHSGSDVSAMRRQVDPAPPIHAPRTVLRRGPFWFGLLGLCGDGLQRRSSICHHHLRTHKRESRQDRHGALSNSIAASFSNVSLASSRSLARMACLPCWCSCLS